MQQVLCLAKVIISYFFSGLVYFLLNEIQIKRKTKLMHKMKAWNYFEMCQYQDMPFFLLFALQDLYIYVYSNV